MRDYFEKIRNKLVARTQREGKTRDGWVYGLKKKGISIRKENSIYNVLKHVYLFLKDTRDCHIKVYFVTTHLLKFSDRLKVID